MREMQRRMASAFVSADPNEGCADTGVVHATGVGPLCLGLVCLLVGVGSWFGWIKVRWITMGLFEKSNEAIFIRVGTVFSVVGLVRLL